MKGAPAGLCSFHYRPIAQPTDRHTRTPPLQAVLVAALKFFREDLRNTWLRLEETPFDSVAKLMGTRYQRTGLDRHTWFFKVPDLLSPPGPPARPLVPPSAYRSLGFLRRVRRTC